MLRTVFFLAVLVCVCRADSPPVVNAAGAYHKKSNPPMCTSIVVASREVFECSKINNPLVTGLLVFNAVCERVFCPAGAQLLSFSGCDRAQGASAGSYLADADFNVATGTPVQGICATNPDPTDTNLFTSGICCVRP